MQGIYTSVTKIRRQVFAAVAKLAYEHDEYSSIEELPYQIIPGEVPTYRDSVFVERAIVGERLRLAMGLPLRRADEHSALSKGVTECAVPKKFFSAPLVDVISFACNACPTNSYEVSNNCRGCLAHPCTNRSAQSRQSPSWMAESFIDKEKCVQAAAAASRPVHIAPSSTTTVPARRPAAWMPLAATSLGRAKIDHDKCVSCGQCIVNCPFGGHCRQVGDLPDHYQSIKRGRQGTRCGHRALFCRDSSDLWPRAEKLSRGPSNILGFDDVVRGRPGRGQGRRGRSPSLRS